MFDRLEELSFGSAKAKVRAISLPQQPLQAPVADDSSEINNATEGEQAPEARAGDDVTASEHTDVSVQEAAEPQRPTQGVENLKDELAHAKRDLDFERIYRGSYGTQLKALVALQAYSDGLTQDDLVQFFLEHQRLSRGLPAYTHTTFAGFMGYLVRLALIEHDPVSRVYKSTTKGQDFLAYLVTQGLSAETKAL